MGNKKAVIIIEDDKIIQDASLKFKSNSSDIDEIPKIVVLKSNKYIKAVNITGITTKYNLFCIRTFYWNFSLYNVIPVATETFNEDTSPLIGILNIKSDFSIMDLFTPLCSDPTINAVGIDLL